MGKAEQRQAKLSFNGGKRKGSISAPQSGEVQMDDGPSEVSVKSMFMDLKSSLAVIDTKLDHLTEQMDRIRARVDEHDARRWRISGMGRESACCRWSDGGDY
ncbi:hypothetical protein NDU88_005449 [Pleurodeles waltl]|uniref:Uncharacterized protein n=1 Tax=Pleurodeles waltl TaxID=8319 RepID=A0AAV7VJW7_PLEWA|nr:hypothetical protein NDU88_005449 [Pleurodeles waltl]